VVADPASPGRCPSRADPRPYRGRRGVEDGDRGHRRAGTRRPRLGIGLGAEPARPMRRFRPGRRSDHQAAGRFAGNRPDFRDLPRSAVIVRACRRCRWTSCRWLRCRALPSGTPAAAGPHSTDPWPNHRRRHLCLLRVVWPSASRRNRSPPDRSPPDRSPPDRSPPDCSPRGPASPLRCDWPTATRHRSQTTNALASGPRLEPDADQRTLALGTAPFLELH
jgi:hypothetical protein